MESTCADAITKEQKIELLTMLVGILTCRLGGKTWVTRSERREHVDRYLKIAINQTSGIVTLSVDGAAGVEAAMLPEGACA